MEEAFAVLTTLELLVSRHRSGRGAAEQEIYVSPSLNGRESGFHLTAMPTPRSAAFARYRNTRDVVVYYGDREDFDAYGVPTPTCFDRLKSYPRESWHEAGNFTLAHLSS